MKTNKQTLPQTQQAARHPYIYHRIYQVESSETYTRQPDNSVLMYKIISPLAIFTSDEISLLIRHQTYNSQVMGSSPDWAPLCRGLGQATYTCVPLSPSSIIWYWPSDSDLFDWERNCGPGGK